MERISRDVDVSDIKILYKRTIGPHCGVIQKGGRRRIERMCERGKMTATRQGAGHTTAGVARSRSFSFGPRLNALSHWTTFDVIRVETVCMITYCSDVLLTGFAYAQRILTTARGTPAILQCCSVNKCPFLKSMSATSTQQALIHKLMDHHVCPFEEHVQETEESFLTNEGCREAACFCRSARSNCSKT